MEDCKVIHVEHLPIRLGQYLKMANLVQDGLEAKIRIQYGEVELNGEVATQRGKQLNVDDIVVYGGNSYKVAIS